MPRKTIFSVMRANPEKWWTVKDMAAELGINPTGMSVQVNKISYVLEFRKFAFNARFWHMEFRMKHEDISSKTRAQQIFLS